MRRGLSAEGVERLHGIAERHVGPDRAPGLVVLVACGDDVHVETLGTLSIDGAPVARDSLFRITSTTKPITAAATLALADEGLIALDDPVDPLLPELAQRRVLMHMDAALNRTVEAWRAITPRDLLSFTFGFGMALEMLMSPAPWPIVAADAELRLNTIGPPDPTAKPDPDTWMANLGSLPLITQPGERWLYNTGASVLGVLCARAAGVPFSEVVRTRVCEPLGMRDTSFWTLDTGRLATAYRPTPDGLVIFDEPGGAWSRPPAFEDGAAGLLSTADDLLAFGRMLLSAGAGAGAGESTGTGTGATGSGAGPRGTGGTRVLSAEAVREMTSDQLNADQKARGGLGPRFFDGRSWGFCQAVYADGCFGWDGGFGTSWLVDPSRDLVVIALTQRMWESSDVPQVHRDIQVAARAAAIG